MSDSQAADNSIKYTMPVLALRHHEPAIFINSHFKRMVFNTCIHLPVPKSKASVHSFLTS